MAFFEQIVLSILLIITIGVSTSSTTDVEGTLTVNLSKIFESWIKEHGRNYTSNEEKEKRFSIFTERFHRIENFNNERKYSYRLGINPYSDMTFEEFREKYACTIDIPKLDTYPNSIKEDRYEDFKLENIPKKWDWRTRGAVTNIKQQGRCNSCWAFSTAAALEGLTPFYNKPYGKLMNLSVQELITCSKPYGNHGCFNGSTLWAMRYVLDHGLLAGEKFPYRFADDQSCNKTFASQPDLKISDCKIVRRDDEVALLKAVYYQPVAVIHSISDAFQEYHGGIFLDADGECTKSNISHSGTLVGFGTNAFGEDYWILKNSWGSQWGEHGYMRIRRNSENKSGVCNLATLPAFCIL